MATVLVAAPAAGASVLPQPSADNELRGVSCVSTSDCWAVGWAQDMNNNVNGETMHWNGSSWVELPSSATTGATLESVSCTSSTTCWAVGNVGNGQTFPRPLIVRFNGSSWASVSAPRLHHEVLRAISCSSATNCAAVGTQGSGRTLALHWNGHRWTQTRTPDPGPKYGEGLTTVSCPAARNCWAFGYYYAAPLKPTVTGYLMALHWNGSVWKRQWTSAPYPGADSSAYFQLAITCASPGSCWAAGDWSISPVSSHPLLVHFNGHKWAPVHPPRLKSASLQAVTCSSTRNCWSVGSAGTSYGGTSGTLALHWNGSRWARVSTPRATNSSLAGVACASSSSCWAVGNDQAGNGSLNIALRWTGGVWSAF